MLGIDRTCPEGNSALLYACKRGRYDIATALLDADANPNLQNVDRDTPLIIATQKVLVLS